MQLQNKTSRALGPVTTFPEQETCYKRQRRATVPRWFVRCWRWGWLNSRLAVECKPFAIISNAWLHLRVRRHVLLLLALGSGSKRAGKAPFRTGSIKRPVELVEQNHWRKEKKPESCNVFFVQPILFFVPLFPLLGFFFSLAVLSSFF
jgi:hypothetical protein